MCQVNRIMLTLSAVTSLAIALYACAGSSDGQTDGEAGSAAASAAGSAGTAGSAGGAGASHCTCDNPHCDSIEEMCQLAELSSCPTTIEDALDGANWVQNGCGTVMLGYYSGTANGQNYCFDAATGELLGGTRYNDHPWGPCFQIAYTFGDMKCGPSGLTSCPEALNCNCSFVKPCDPPLSDCLEGVAGVGAAGGQAGAGGE